MRELPADAKNILQFGGFPADTKLLRFPEILTSSTLPLRFDDQTGVAPGQLQRGAGTPMPNGRGAAAKASCENCFFHANLLCAIPVSEGPCATFRPAHPEGLRPPGQLRFVFRQERRLQVAWAFPSPSEQVALHA